MATDDFRINAAVHNTLVRLWIDANRLKFGTANGVVYLRGSLARMTFAGRGKNDAEKDMTFVVRRLDSELKAIRGVKEIAYDLDNVTHLSGRWIAREAS